MVGLTDPAAGKMMDATDPPCHQRIRESLGKPLSARAVPAYAALVRSLVREMLAQAAEIWAAVAALARLPVALIARLMGRPAADVDRLHCWAYASITPVDEQYRVGPKHRTLQVAHMEMADYFTWHVRSRRNQLLSDLASHIAGLEVAGRPLTEEEAVLNFHSLLVGGVVTTGPALSATLIALAKQGGGRWDFRPPVAPAVEEALRWASPATHFMRCADRDVVLRGVRIRAGEAVAAWIGSANRDEEVFDRPYTFDPARTPNRHLAFGNGSHRCGGARLARLVLRNAFDELSARVDSFALAGAPVHTRSSMIARVVSLPVRVQMRPVR